MTAWRTRTPEEVADLAIRLRAVDWTWQLTEIPRIAEHFGWTVISSKPAWALLDTGLGPASGKAFADNGLVERLQVDASTIGPDTIETRTQVHATYTAMADALVAALGEPTAEADGDLRELRWARPDSTLLLQELARSIKLSLVTNEWLTGFDHRVQLSRQGQL
ncbi:DUF6301 family protein [Nocardia sp. FBN12]|uniref:DUF6301 family protein n=1 Tax=Nocardia sp. FBN12 TaxID=3419766 RepID=UPI003D03E01F